MKRTLIALALLAAFGAAQAQSTSDANTSSTATSQGGAGGQGGTGIGGTSNSTSSASANPIASANSVGNQSNSRAAVSGVSAGANGNNAATQSINFNSAPAPATQGVNYSGGTTSDVRYSGGTNSTDHVEYSGTQTIKNVPGIAMSGPASGPCTGNSGGVGIAGPGFGVGLNGAKVDDGCTVRENTRVLGQVYQSIAAGPIKDEAATAVLNGLRILANMNAKIGGDYAPPPAPQPVAGAAPVSYAPRAGEPTDPYVRSRMGLPVAK